MQQQTLRILAGGLSDTSLSNGLNPSFTNRRRHVLVFFGQSFVVFDHL
jgi:hypothetical protein